MDNIRSIDDLWGVVEINPAVIDKPKRIPGHDESYKTLLETLNAGAMFLSPMWGSRMEDQKLKPRTFRSYDAMEGTPFEYQMAWWLIALQAYPAKSMHFPFGNDMVESLDGWIAGPNTHATPGKGEARLDGKETIELISPVWGPIKLGRQIQIIVNGSWQGRKPTAEILFGSGATVRCSGNQQVLNCSVSPSKGDTLRKIRLLWHGESGSTPESVVLDNVTILAIGV
jgi:hypothetical protein